MLSQYFWYVGKVWIFCILEETMWGEIILVLRDGNLIPNAVKWDDQMISDILVTQNRISNEEAQKITKSLKEDIEGMGLDEIKIPLLEKILCVKCALRLKKYSTKN